MRRRGAVCLLAACLVGLMAAPASAQAEQEPVRFLAHLDPGQVEPRPRSSQGGGVATLGLDENGSIQFQVITFGLEDITQVHLHLAGRHESGPAVVTLFDAAPLDAPAGETRHGILVRGTIGPGDLSVLPAEEDPSGVGFAGTLEDLSHRLGRQAVYLDVHTVTSPPGELRGQLQPLVGPRRFVDIAGNSHAADILAIAVPVIRLLGCQTSQTDRYCPGQPVTRAQAAGFLARTLHLPTAEADHFSDDDGAPFEVEINALAQLGIALGCDPPAHDSYCPDRPVTRAEMASLLARALRLPEGSAGEAFVDDDGSTHEADIERLAAAGITSGCNPEGDHYCPQDPVRRDQMASFLARSLWP